MATYQQIADWANSRGRGTYIARALPIAVLEAWNKAHPDDPVRVQRYSFKSNVRGTQRSAEIREQRRINALLEGKK